MKKKLELRRAIECEIELAHIHSTGMPCSSDVEIKLWHFYVSLCCRATNINRVYRQYLIRVNSAVEAPKRVYQFVFSLKAVCVSILVA